MKIITFLALISSASAFQVMQTKVSQTSLKMGMFDFKPMHGSGTGSTKDELDEQYRLQQEILKARRDHVNFDSLHDKYSKDKQDLDVFSLGAKHEDDKYQQSYFEVESLISLKKKEQKKKSFKFPWDMKP